MKHIRRCEFPIACHSQQPYNDQSINNIFVSLPLIDRRQPAKEKEAKKAANKFVLSNRKAYVLLCSVRARETNGKQFSAGPIAIINYFVSALIRNVWSGVAH